MIEEFITIAFNQSRKEEKELIEKLEKDLKELRMKYSYGMFER